MINTDKLHEDEKTLIRLIKADVAAAKDNDYIDLSDLYQDLKQCDDGSALTILIQMELDGQLTCSHDL